MAKLPLLQKLLNRRSRKEKKLVIIANGCYSGIKFVLMVEETDKNDTILINAIKNQFIPYMQSDYPLEEVSKILKKDNIHIDEKYFLEGIMFIVFRWEL